MIVVIIIAIMMMSDDDDNKHDDNNNNNDRNIILKIYRISQDPITKNYNIIYPDGYYCNKCGELYINIKRKCCKLCHLKTYFANTASRNEKIDRSSDIIFEWILHNQFSNIKKRVLFFIAPWESWAKLRNAGQN